MSTTTPGAHDAEPAALRLEPVSGPHMDAFDLKGVQHVRIGRALECELCLVDSSVSRTHAALSSRGARWFLSDLGSRHGTMLNGMKLEPNLPAPMAIGDLIRIGPWEFRLSGADTTRPAALHTMDDTRDPRREVHTMVEADMAGIARQRLSLLLKCAAELNEAKEESDLAEALLRSAITGTGFGRAAILRATASEQAVEFVSSMSAGGARTKPFEVSRSLIRGASLGRVARLRARDAQDYGQSIAELGIHSALCLPLQIDEVIVAYLYLDARADEARLQPDAAEFCLGLSRFAGLALAKIKRGELESRRQGLESQLHAARDAQQMIMPAGDGVVGGLRYAMRMRPGMYVAGDLFDVIELEGGRVGVCLGDVTGEGVGAGLLMASTQAHLHSALVLLGDPGKAVREVNRYIAARSAADKFVSLWVGVFDPAARKLTFVDAGHGHWMLSVPGQPPRTPMAGGGIPIGIDPDATYESIETNFEPGHRVVIYSDGIVEQRSGEGEQFGRDRVIEALRGDFPTPASAVAAVFQEVERFAHRPELADDASIAVVELIAD